MGAELWLSFKHNFTRPDKLQYHRVILLGVRARAPVCQGHVAVGHCTPVLAVHSSNRLAVLHLPVRLLMLVLTLHS
jgi:hypothetical protein